MKEAQTIIEVRPIETSDWGKCNCCDNAPTVLVRLGKNNASMSNRLCGECADEVQSMLRRVQR